MAEPPSLRRKLEYNTTTVALHFIFKKKKKKKKKKKTIFTYNIYREKLIIYLIYYNINLIISLSNFSNIYA